jgi:hypothetical protein
MGGGDRGLVGGAGEDEVVAVDDGGAAHDRDGGRVAAAGIGLVPEDGDRGLGAVAASTASTSAGGAFRNRPTSKRAAMRTGSANRSAKPSSTASAASSQVSFAISAAMSSSDPPDLPT